jgi:hypothetical protein
MNLFNFFMKPKLDTVRADCLRKLANLDEAGRQEIVESIIKIYLRDFHLHRDPQRKVKNEPDSNQF